MWDLDKGEVGRVSALKPDLVNGQIWWSSNSKAILYLQTESDCAPHYGKTYITRLDLTDLSQKLLVEYPGPSTEVAMTPVPSGVFALLIYPPLVMNYDPSVWKDESQYGDSKTMSIYFVTNYLQSLTLETCRIGRSGPTGDFPVTPENTRLGDVRYQVITLADSPSGFITAYYIEDKSLKGFNYELGAPILFLQASSSEWEECKALAENVLATLHVP